MASQPSNYPVQQARGYPRLASTMTTNSEFTILRRFTKLNRLNLLRLQAELQVLEDELQDICSEDESSGQEERVNLTIDFQAVRDSEGTGHSHYFQKLEKISAVLKEYNEALIQNSMVEKIPRPTSVDLREYQKWLAKWAKGGGELFPRDWENSYGEEFNYDQLTFKEPNTDPDPIQSFFDGPFQDMVHRVRGKSRTKHVDGVTKYNDEMYHRTSRIVSAAISSTIPTVCIVVLYFIPSLIVRLGVMCAFTTAFSMALALFTSGKKHEIFSATAAFAAVEVVFIGSTSYIGEGKTSPQ